MIHHDKTPLPKGAALSFTGSGEAVRGDLVRIHVLLITDFEPPKALVVQTFGQACFHVDFAKTLLQAQQAAQDEESSHDILFLDLDLASLDVDQPIAIVQMVMSHFPLASLVTLGGKLSGEQEAQLLSLGVASLRKPVSLDALAVVAMRLSAMPKRDSRPLSSFQTPTQPSVPPLEAAIRSYCVERGLSKQQMRILTLHLRGLSDKEIAHRLECSLTTVYEHWRRMAKKVGAVSKQAVAADFLRFIGAA